MSFFVVLLYFDFGVGTILFAYLALSAVLCCPLPAWTNQLPHFSYLRNLLHNLGNKNVSNAKRTAMFCKIYGICLLLALVLFLWLILEGCRLLYHEFSGTPRPEHLAPINPNKEQVVKGALYITLTERRGVYPVITPLSPNDIACRIIFYKGNKNVFECAVQKPVNTLEDTAIFKQRLNHDIKRHLDEGSFPNIYIPKVNGRYVLMVGEVIDRGIFWNIYIGVFDGQTTQIFTNIPTPKNADKEDKHYDDPDF